MGTERRRLVAVADGRAGWDGDGRVPIRRMHAALLNAGRCWVVVCPGHDGMHTIAVAVAVRWAQRALHGVHAVG